jgi:hypothetical protein
MKVILESDEKGPGMEVMALVINLAVNKKNAALICGGGSVAGKEGLGLKLLFKRAFKYEDPLVMKTIRNIAQHDGPIKSFFMVGHSPRTNHLFFFSIFVFPRACRGRFRAKVTLDYDQCLLEHFWTSTSSHAVQFTF